MTTGVRGIVDAGDRMRLNEACRGRPAAGRQLVGTLGRRMTIGAGRRTPALVARRRRLAGRAAAESGA